MDVVDLRTALFVSAFFCLNPPAPRNAAIRFHDSMLPPGHEVLEELNFLDGDGFCVHRAPMTKPPMPDKSTWKLTGEIQV